MRGPTQPVSPPLQVSTETSSMIKPPQQKRDYASTVAAQFNYAALKCREACKKVKVPPSIPRQLCHCEIPRLSRVLILGLSCLTLLRVPFLVRKEGAPKQIRSRQKNNLPWVCSNDLGSLGVSQTFSKLELFVNQSSKKVFLESNFFFWSENPFMWLFSRGNFPFQINFVFYYHVFQG